MITQLLPNSQIEKPVSEDYFDVCEKSPVVSGNSICHYESQTPNKEFVIFFDLK